MTETIPQPRTAAADQTETVSPEEGAAPESAKPGLLILAPLRIEANAVRRGLTQSTSHVLHTGMGATRAKRSAEKGTTPSFFGGVAVMGTAASLSDDLHPGDLVVATEVSDGETTVTLPGADLLAAGERDSKATERGLRWLARTQRADGTWDEPYFTGTGFPGDFYLNYHLYRLAFPVSALGRFVGDAAPSPTRAEQIREG